MSDFDDTKCGPHKGPPRRARNAARNAFYPSGVARAPVCTGPGAPGGLLKRRRKYFEIGRRRRAGNVRWPVEKCATETSPRK